VTMQVDDLVAVLHERAAVNKRAHDPAASVRGILGVLPGAAIRFHIFNFHETRRSR